jgi:hypothetical protein
MTRSRNLRLLGASITMAGVLAVPSVVYAQSDRPTAEPTTDVRTVDRTPRREALHMKCRQVEPGVAAVECAWRPATHPAAAGYQLWRIVDRGHRELVWRGGLDATSHVSPVPADASVARYAVLAVNKDGRIVGRSRVQTVHLRLPEPPTDVRPAKIERAATSIRHAVGTIRPF